MLSVVGLGGCIFTRSKMWKYSRHICLSVALLLAQGSLAWAADWHVQPQVTVREVFTDNIRLAPNKEESQFVTEAIPGIFVRGAGRRIKLNLMFNLQAVSFPSGDFDDALNPQFESAGTAELVEEVVFLDLGSTITQANVDNSNRRASDNISQTENRVDVYTYRVSPFLRNRFGNYAESELRYEFDEVIYEGDTLDSKGHKGHFLIDSGSRFARLPWQLFVDAQAIEFEDGTTVDFANTGGNLRYVISRKLSIFGGGGYELNDFVTTQGDEDGFFWQVGSAWSPSPRTTFEGGYGERFFGGNFFFTGKHQSRRTVVRVAFREEATLTRDVDLQRQIVPLTDPFGEPVVVPVSRDNLSIATDEATRTSEVFVRERFDGSMFFRGRRTDGGLGGFHEKRNFQETGEEETEFGLFFTVKRRLSRQISVRMGGQWQQTNFRDRFREDTRWEGNIGLTYSAGRSIEGSLQYRFITQESNISAGEFEESRITAGLTIKF